MAMKNGEYLILEYHALNDLYDRKLTRLRDAEVEASKLAEQTGKIMVVVKIVDLVIKPDKEQKR